MGISLALLSHKAIMVFMVCVTINVEKKVFDHEPSIVEVLEHLDFPRSAVAVEVNRTIVPKRSHPKLLLRDGDEVEVVTFVGGG